MHIETTLLVDGTYEFFKELDKDFSEASTEVVELIEAPNSDSEEPKSTDSIDPSKSKPRCIILLFQIMQFIITFTRAFKLLELNENPRCIILRYQMIEH